MMATSVQIQSLTKRFGQTTAVDAVDLDVPQGDLFFLLGPSGCGKTTLLRCLAGFIDPDGGVIRFGDRDVTHLPPEKRNTGMVCQSYALWPHMTVAQNVAFGLQVRKQSRQAQAQRVAEALRMVRLDLLADRKPNQLSGGQQQRVALARAMVVRPDLLLLDEPLSNLDAKLRLEMRSQIREICKSTGITAVYVTHDQKEALSMADRIAVMQSGRIEQVGTPRQLYQRPANRFVADFLGESNFLSCVVRAVDDDVVTLETPFGELQAAVDGAPPRDGQEVTCSIRPESVRVDDGAGGAETSNAFHAALKGTMYLGEMAQHELLIGEGALLKAFEINPPPREAGSRLRVSIDRTDVVLLQAEVSS